MNIDRFAGGLTLVVCAAVLAAGIHFGSRACAGSDSFGYVSQAYLWLNRTLRVEQPIVRELPWPYARESASPLAFTPGGPTTIVPVYPAGLPLIMAAFILSFGACGPYLVAPVFGVLLTGGTYVLGVRLTGSRSVAFVAAALMATSPAFLFNVMQPMSDTVAAALWTASMAALTWRGLGSAGLAGSLAGAAILVRPNLAPLVLAGLLAAWGRSRIAAYLLGGPVPAVVTIAALNAYLYGSPFRTGYPAAQLFSIEFPLRNAVQFGSWVVQSEGVLLAVLAASAAIPTCRPVLEWQRWRASAAFAAIVIASYLFYSPHDAWWYLRFLLPAFPLMFILIASSAVGCAAMLRPGAAAAALGLFVAAAATARVWPHASEILTVGAGEDRYPAMAEFIDRALPPNAVIIGMQHSGTVRLYAGRPTLRYEWFAPPRIGAAVDWLNDRGYRPYILLESWEESGFRRRFAEAGAIGRLDIPVVAELPGTVHVKLYDPLQSAGNAAPPFRIAPRHGRCVPPSPRWPHAIWDR